MDIVKEFLMSDEMMIVGAVALVSSLLILLVFVIEKGYNKRKRINNTRELNELILEEDEMKKNEENTDFINSINVEVIEEKQSVVEDLVETIEEPIKEEKPLVIPIEEYENTSKEDKVEILDDSVPTVEQIYTDVVEELQYTTIEPNQEEAKEELKKLTEELIKKEQEESKNIELTKFEEEQEENAIISIDELMLKGNEMYEKNEVTQYEDEGNEPISLQDLELRMNSIKEEVEKIQIEETVEEVISNVEEVETNNRVVLDDFNTIDKNTNIYRDDVVFKSSPIISPIFGIEEKVSPEVDMMFENTANYEKFDDEIRKTNEFLVTLRELQKKLD